ncbi:MAG: L,D-transpeptidase family protein [Sphingomicrobium sp.]
MKPTLLKSLLGATIAFASFPALAATSPEFAPASPSALSAPADVADLAAVDAFYAQRGNAPLWLKQGPSSPAASALVETLRRAPLDGLYSGPQLADEIQAALASAKDRAGLARADRLISSAYLRYVAALHAPAPGMVYVDARLAPRAPAAGYVLEQAARASSLPDHLAAVSAANPMYAELRDAAWAQAKTSGTGLPDARVMANLDRLRALPASGRFILVNAATQQLSMVDNGRVIDSMKVVVGRPDAQTPMVASTIWYATFNPYWNIPADLGRKLIAPHVVKDGTSWLAKNGYEVIADWDTPTVLPASSVNWKGVLAGTTEVKLRELPGSDNSMGMVKFGFGNPQGIYLHDTNNRLLFNQDQRTASNGCVRLEDAKRLGQWLMGAPLAAPSPDPELNVRLPQGVPVYISYITARADHGQVAFTDDVYHRDVNSDRLASR